MLIIIGFFIITGCNNEENKDTFHPNQTGYVEGQYSVDNLTFNLYEGFKQSFEENIYQLANDKNGIVIYFYHDQDIKNL